MPRRSGTPLPEIVGMNLFYQEVTLGTLVSAPNQNIDADFIIVAFCLWDAIVTVSSVVYDTGAEGDVTCTQIIENQMFSQGRQYLYIGDLRGIAATTATLKITMSESGGNELGLMSMRVNGLQSATPQDSKDKRASGVTTTISIVNAECPVGGLAFSFGSHNDEGDTITTPGSLTLQQQNAGDQHAYACAADVLPGGLAPSTETYTWSNASSFHSLMFASWR